MKKVAPLFLTVGLSLGSLARAQIQSPGARTLFANSYLVRSDWRVADDDRVVWENAFVYGLPKSFMVMGIVPWVSDATSGVGDPMFVLQYDGLFSRNRAGGFTRLAGFLGGAPAWGSDAVSSGRTSFLQGLIFTHASPRFFWTGGVQRTAISSRPDGYRADASVMYRARRFPENRDLFLVLELNTFFDRTETSLDESVFLAPGVEFFLRGDLALEASLQVPVHRAENTGRSWSVLTGFRYVR